jgi:hypothetical protein
MNPKKKSRRCRASVSIQALDLAISRFIHSLDLDPPNFSLYTTFNVDGTQTYLIISFYSYANRNNSMVN